MDCFGILGINSTKDAKEIRKAYSKLLTKYSPENDPEGFQKIRKAYEEALASTKEDNCTNQEELSPLDRFMKDFEDTYENFEKRLDLDCWTELLERDICCNIETSKEVSNKILIFIMDNFNKTW